MAIPLLWHIHHYSSFSLTLWMPVRMLIEFPPLVGHEQFRGEVHQLGRIDEKH
jgi:hypothetical protein